MDGAFQEPVITGLGHERARRPAINILLEDAKRLIGVRCRRAEVDMPVAGYVRRGRKLARKRSPAAARAVKNGVVGSPSGGCTNGRRRASHCGGCHGSGESYKGIRTCRVSCRTSTSLMAMRFLAIEDRNDPPITIIIHLEQERRSSSPRSSTMRHMPVRGQWASGPIRDHHIPDQAPGPRPAGSPE